MLAGSGARPRPRSDNEQPPLWTVMPEWLGETGFIVGGGPSVSTQPIEKLAGRRVLVINASYALVPDAEFLFFNDSDFWTSHRDKVGIFKGQIVTAEKRCRGSGLIRLNRRPPIGLTDDRCSVGVDFSSFTGALDILHLLGVKRIVALGLDGGPNAAGKTHHHAPHAHAHTFEWQRQRGDLQNYVASLNERGIEMLNVSPGSTIPFWPIVDRLEDVL